MAQGGGQQQQSLADGLKKVHSALADLKLSPQGMSGPGAQFIDAMMQAIQGFTAQQAQATIGQGQGQPGQGQPGQARPGQAPGGAPQMAGMGAGMGPPSMPSMGAGGGPAGGPGSAVGLTPTPDSMDEISRMLNSGGVNP